MHTVVPLLAFILLFLIFYKIERCWRSSVLSAAVVWGVLVTLLTEILSSFRLLKFDWLLGLWILITIILAFINLWLARKNKERNLIKKLSKINISCQLPIFSIVLLYCVAFITVAVALSAIVAPPNNWESMNYHMTRVVHWIQNHSVVHYPTHYTPQLFHPPWAEFTIMHFQILSGGDRLANLIQWFSMLGSIIGVSLIAKQLGADSRSQVFAAVVSATLPMGILQGATTQNDYAVTFWVVCFVYYVLLTLQEKINQTHALRIGASLGLALFTKTTAYFYTFPFLVWFFISGLKRLRGKLWKLIIMIGFIVFFINMGHYLRNFEIFQSPIGDPTKHVQDYKIEFFSLPTILSNIIRNLSIHIGTPIGYINGALERVIRLIHTLLGLEVDDYRITSGAFWIQKTTTLEDRTGNTLHFLLVLLALSICLSRKNYRRQRHLVSYVVAIVLSFLLFCLFLKYQQTNSRLHLTFFVLLSVVVGEVLSKLSNWKVANSIAAFLVLTSLFWVFYSESRPWIGNINIFNSSRIDQYFISRPYLKAPYKETVNFVKSKDCWDVGLSVEAEPWEYPLWVLWQTDGKVSHIEHVNVANPSVVKSDIYPHKKFNPCAIIYIGTQQEEKFTTKNSLYIREFSVNYKRIINVFIRKKSIN